MKSTDDRKLFTTLIGADATAGDIVVIPATQTTAGDGTASIADGFPAETFISTSAGGKRPRGQDVNGFLNLLSDAARVLQAENFGPYSSALSAAIGGYPLNAVVSAGTAGAFWVSTAEDNTTVPGNAGASWQSLFAGLAPLAANNTWTGSNAFNVGPTVPTPAAGTNNTQAANTAYADRAVATETSRAEAAEATKAALNGSASQPFSVSNLTATTGVFNNIQAYTSSGTFTVPAGVTKVRAIVTGGGGGGANSSSTTLSTSTNYSGGGGGAGGTMIGVFSVTPEQQISVTVGSGGGAQTAGGTSTFGSFGGASGGSGSYFQTTGNSAGQAGGDGSGGDITIHGGSGSDGQNGPSQMAGNGGASFWGGGGRAGSGGGISALAYGAGGGGAYDSATGVGGSGANGIVVVEW